MAITQNTYTGNGSTVLFSFTFPYLETTDIKVSVNGTVTTAYTLANATTIQFNTAPVNGAAIRIYRQTDDAALAATFYPGSAIRSNDLNDNFTQNLYVTQESSNNASTANTTANTALTNSNTAISTANSATNTANTASTNASAAVATANTASANASAAVSTANTASTNATTAVNTANTALSTANAATTTANAASSSAASAVSTANTASTNATTAVSTANSAQTAASSAVSTANSASTAATNAVNTANSASSTASGAVTTANTANSKADQAIAAVSSSINYTLVTNVAGIPANPANDTYVEVGNSTGIESFTPLAGKPAGFVGDSGLSVRMRYTTAGATWNWQNYYPNNAETRYLKLSGGTLSGNVTAPALIPSGSTAPSLGLYTPSAGSVAISTGGAGRLFVDASGNVGLGTSSFPYATGGRTCLDINGSSTSLINLKYGNVVGLTAETSSSAAAITAGGTTIPLVFYTNGSERLRITSAGLVGIGTSSPSAKLVVSNNGANGLEFFPELYADTNTIASFNRSTSSYKSLRFECSDYAFLTGATTAVSINSSGRVGIGASPSANLHVRAANSDTTADLLRLEQFNAAATDSARLVIQANAATNEVIYNSTGQQVGAHVFQRAGTESARISNSGQLLVGTSSARSNFFNSTLSSLFQVEGTNSPNAGRLSSFTYGANDANGPILVLAKHRGSTGQTTVVQADDEAGIVTFQAGDGTEFIETARITSFVDGTPGANDMPGRLVFSTTSDNSASPSERVRISSTGAIGLSGANYGTSGQVLTSSGSGAAPTWQPPTGVSLGLAIALG